MPSRKLEELCQTSFEQILNWVHRFEREGIDGLRNREGRGRKSALSPEQLQLLSNVIDNESPTEHGFKIETWTGPMFIEWVGRNFKVEYEKAQIYNILKKLGYTHQKAKSFYPEADPKAQEEFKEALKKLLESPLDTVLLYEDEFSLSNTATMRYKWGKKR